jgi:hypothetical protein
MPVITVGTAQVNIPDNYAAVLQRFTANVKQPDGTTRPTPMTLADIERFGVIRGKFKGTYHTEREFLPL